MQPYFHELKVDSFADKTILLDIDGTIAYDGAKETNADAVETIKKMAKRNKIFLHSNCKNQKRIGEFARQLGVTPLISEYRKPNRGVFESLTDAERNSLVVIGDKWLTDGLSAKRAGARFIKVRRLVNQKESPYIKLIYALDDFAYGFLNFFSKIYGQ